jgi:hypothetical protein
MSVVFSRPLKALRLFFALPVALLNPSIPEFVLYIYSGFSVSKIEDGKLSACDVIYLMMLASEGQHIVLSCTMRSGIECLKRNRKNSHQQPLPGSLGKTGRAKAGVNIPLSQ